MKLFAPYLANYKTKLFICFTFMMLFALVSGFSLSLLSPFLNAIFYNKPALPDTHYDLLIKFNNWVLGESKLSALIKIQVMLVLVFLSKGIFSYINRYLGVSVEENITKDIRNKTYSHLEKLSLDYFHGTNTGIIISRLTNDISKIRDSIKDGMLAYLRLLLLVFVCLCFAAYISWRLMLISVIILPLFGYILNKLAKKLREKSNKVQEDMGKIITLLGEIVGGIKIVKAFLAEPIEKAKFFKSTQNYLKSALKFERVSLIGNPLAELVTAIGSCLIIGYGSYEILIAKSLTPDRFLVFLACTLSIMEALRQLPMANVKLQEGTQAIIRINRILDIKPSITEISNPTHLAFNKQIKFQEVQFSYETSQTVLSNISLKINKGENVALVGPSGAGKSTLTELLLRFYDPTEGVITIDDIDIKRVYIKELRGIIGLVTQDPILFNDTVSNNIAYGFSTIDQDRVFSSAKLANADEFINKMPLKYDTVIGERGVKLSGGERQRLAIARVLYKNPPILIFDEATSHLDNVTESKLQEAIQKLLENRTAIVIAHRLSTVQNMHRIIVMNEGKIVEEGTHEELIKAGNLYQKLAQTELK
ncbi:MAG: ABC transporter ATP-binding protein [bacterium]|nr:ABC transporter ATP-binding protein [bacterium]